LEQSLDIMLWTLRRNDPENWCEPDEGILDDMLSLIAECDGDFKENLDRYKYAPRYEDADPLAHRAGGEKFLGKLNDRLLDQSYLFGSSPSLADYAIAPFIRQFANTDRDWFDAAPYPNSQQWLEAILTAEPFTAVMTKYPVWQAGDAPTIFAG